MKTNHLHAELHQSEHLSIVELEERPISKESGTTMMLVILGIAVLIVVCLLFA